MNAARLLGLAIIMAGCDATASETPTPSSPALGSERAAAASETGSRTAPASPTPADSGPQVAPGGVFVFTPGIMDCPGSPDGCPSYTVAEAIAEPGQPGIPIIVDGYVLIEPDGSGWYCQTLTDSSPPQCAGERLAFDGLDLMGEAGLEELDGVRWSEQVQLLGEVTP